MEERKVLPLTSTATGIKLVAIWKKMERWYIVEGESEDEEEEERNLKKVVDKLTPRQFQDAVEIGRYSFAW